MLTEARCRLDHAGRMCRSESGRPQLDTQGTLAFESGQRERSQDRGTRSSVRRGRGSPRESGIMETTGERGRQEVAVSRAGVSQRGSWSSVVEGWQQLEQGVETV